MLVSFDKSFHQSGVVSVCVDESEPGSLFRCLLKIWPLPPFPLSFRLAAWKIGGSCLKQRDRQTYRQSDQQKDEHKIKQQCRKSDWLQICSQTGWFRNWELRSKIQRPRFLYSARQIVYLPLFALQFFVPHSLIYLRKHWYPITSWGKFFVFLFLLFMNLIQIINWVIMFSCSKWAICTCRLESKWQFGAFAASHAISCCVTSRSPNFPSQYVSIWYVTVSCQGF